MGMVAFLTSVDNDKLAGLKADPGQMVDFLFPENEDGDEEPENTIDIDKAWHGIHFILCALAKDDHSPLVSAILGGQELGDDLGYGPPRVLDPTEVQAIAALLSQISPEQFESVFNPSAMSAADIYPDIWEREGKVALEYLTHFFPTLVTFYTEAADRGDGAVLYLA